LESSFLFLGLEDGFGHQFFFSEVDSSDFFLVCGKTRMRKLRRLDVASPRLEGGDAADVASYDCRSPFLLASEGSRGDPFFLSFLSSVLR